MVSRSSAVSAVKGMSSVQRLETVSLHVLSVLVVHVGLPEHCGSGVQASQRGGAPVHDPSTPHTRDAVPTTAVMPQMAVQLSASPVHHSKHVFVGSGMRTSLGVHMALLWLLLVRVAAVVAVEFLFAFSAEATVLALSAALHCAGAAVVSAAAVSCPAALELAASVVLPVAGPVADAAVVVSRVALFFVVFATIDCMLLAVPLAAAADCVVVVLPPLLCSLLLHAAGKAAAATACRRYCPCRQWYSATLGNRRASAEATRTVPGAVSRAAQSTPRHSGGRPVHSPPAPQCRTVVCAEGPRPCRR